MKKLYFLGPKGTYSELAAKKINNILNNKYILEDVSTIVKIVELVKDGNVGVLPIENSIEGIVRPTIDSLYESDIKIQAQLDIEINHCLFSKGKKENIKHIISHPQAIAQCSKYILNNFDNNIQLINSTSTAAAVCELLDKDETYAAIGSSAIGEELKLNVIDKNICDVKGNKTRFVLVSYENIELGNKTRTSIVFNTKNESGALLKVLEIFKKHN